MIHLVKNALYEASLTSNVPLGDLRNFKSIRRADWTESPVSQLPDLSWEWGGGLTFSGFTNPLEISFDLSAVIRTANVMDPDEGSEQILKLLWDLDSDSEWGFIPFILANRSIELSPTPYTVLLTPKVGEPIAQRLETNEYTFTCLVLIQCQIQRDPRRLS